MNYSRPVSFVGKIHSLVLHIAVCGWRAPAQEGFSGKICATTPGQARLDLSGKALRQYHTCPVRKGPIDGSQTSMTTIGLECAIIVGAMTFDVIATVHKERRTLDLQSRSCLSCQTSYGSLPNLGRPICNIVSCVVELREMIGWHEGIICAQSSEHDPSFREAALPWLHQANSARYIRFMSALPNFSVTAARAAEVN
jgi:hypothetical protein